MRYCLTLILTTIAFSNLIAQNEVSNTFSGSFNVYPVDTVGVVLLNRNLMQMNNGDLALSFVGLNPRLEKKWENVYPFTKGLSPIFQQVSAKGIILIFSDQKRLNFEVIKANSDFGDYERFKYEFSQPLIIRELTYYYDQLWVAGSIGGLPAIFRLKPDNTVETVPTGAPGLVKYAGEISFNRETRGFDFILLAEVNNKDAIIWRSMAPDGSVLQNEMLTGFQKNKIKSLKATYSNNSAYVAGAYSIGTRDKLEGVFVAEINEVNSQLKLKSIKNLVSFSNAKKVDDIYKTNVSKASTSKLRFSNKVFFVDNLSIKENGELTIAIEVFKPEFRNRSAFEKEIIARDRVDQIDQNVFGRRNNLGAAVGRDLEGRMERASATDQLQYRFMDQSLGKAVNQGISYNHTAIIKLNERLDLLENYGLKFSLNDNGTLSRSSQFKNGTLNYTSGEYLSKFDLSTKKATIQEASPDTQLVFWTRHTYLSVSYDRSIKSLKLLGKRFD